MRDSNFEIENIYFIEDPTSFPHISCHINFIEKSYTQLK